ncbi:hypothetical protein ACFL6U_27910 [Planctomycetota bacterium]
MNIRKTNTKMWLILLMTASAWATDAMGPYFGQTPTGTTPELFAPGILTQPGGLYAVTRIAFSPDGNECFFSGPINASYKGTRMYHMRCVNNVWTPHDLVSFFPGYSCRQPYFSADGNTLYFSSNKNGTSDIWKVEWSPEGWGEPQCLPEPINSSSYDGMYTQTIDGTIYIESNRPGGRGKIDIWQISPEQPGQTPQIHNLSASVNTSGDDNDPVISPDGRYLIFGSNYNDLFVTFNQGENSWTAPVNLNQYCPGINTGRQEYAPHSTHDGQYLFFSRVSAGGIHWIANPIPRPDPNGLVSNLSTGERFGTIQAAVIYAQAGDTLQLQPGIYRESVVLDKDITIQSIDPNDPCIIGGTIIQGDADQPVLTLSNITEACMIVGLTLRAGSIGVLGTNTQAIFRNCRFMDNVTYGMDLIGASPMLSHCLITANGECGISMQSIPATPGRGGGNPEIPSEPLIENCFIVDNNDVSIGGGQPIIVDSLIQ